MRFAVALLIAPSLAFQPVLRPLSTPSTHHALYATKPDSPASVSQLGRRTLEMSEPVLPLDQAVLPPLPHFRWPIVLFFMANPLVLLPLAALVAAILRLDWLGAAFSISKQTHLAGVLYAAPLLAISLVADKAIPALAEVTQASKTISLWAMGATFKPLRALVAAVMISTSAAVAEELAFRGVVQTATLRLLQAIGGVSHLLLLPEQAAIAVAVVAQALLFGVLHSYSSSPAYKATATVAGLAFGAVFAVTNNLYVPMVMHFVVDVVGFVLCHVQVVHSEEVDQRELIAADTPIAVSLRQMLGPRQLGVSREETGA